MPRCHAYMAGDARQIAVSLAMRPLAEGLGMRDWTAMGSLFSQPNPAPPPPMGEAAPGLSAIGRGVIGCESCDVILIRLEGFRSTVDS